MRLLPIRSCLYTSGMVSDSSRYTLPQSPDTLLPSYYTALNKFDNRLGTRRKPDVSMDVWKKKLTVEVYKAPPSRLLHLLVSVPSYSSCVSYLNPVNLFVGPLKLFSRFFSWFQPQYSSGEDGFVDDVASSRVATFKIYWRKRRCRSLIFPFDWNSHHFSRA